ncbi:hypothetical protein DYI25_08120 [Mesobacillus boroniphilus]|uniref:DUF3794 domain-containing protein n=1 Tax=Mesobacillus boroniphilus TaxID=308892 RepID=A0A944GVY1_9BACI|nr:hypothetical protein [Mesobacillus boroniphilus]MBS8264398.1 hypothetical protein [Mesobacillus boroniphilus]
MKMENTNRTFHEMHLFQGNWRNNSVDRRVSERDSEMEKVFEEIDKDLGGNFNESRFRPKGKSSGKPLILAPPVIKSVEEKSSASRRQFTTDEVEEESSELIEVVGGIEDHVEEEIQEGYEESSSEIMFEESSSFHDEEESVNQLLAIDEYGDELHYDENHDESVDYQYESSESSSVPMKLATAAYSGKKTKIEMTKVRLPLHLADVDLEIDIFDTFSLSRPISTVSNVECSLHSIDAEVLLPSANLFTKGTLLLNIDYVSTDDTGTMHSLKLHIPWKKIIPVKWIHQPELSAKDSKEYLFTSNLGMEEGYTREYSESLVEKVNFSLSSLHCVWNEQFIRNDRVMIQGTARMKIELFQKQCLDLQKLLSL